MIELNEFFNQIRQEQKELNDIVDLFNKRTGCCLKHVRNKNEVIDECGVTLLLVFAMHGDSNLVEKIVKLGANLEDHDCYNRTALCFGLFNHKKHMVNSLLKAGANPNVKINTIFGLKKIPLVFYLINYRDIRVYELNLLIKHGVILSDYKLYLDNITYRKSDFFSHFFKVLAKRRWVTIKCVTLILGIHKRAVVTANHPDRLLQQGVFEIEI